MRCSVVVVDFAFFFALVLRFWHGFFGAHSWDCVDAADWIVVGAGAGRTPKPSSADLVLIEEVEVVGGGCSPLICVLP